MELRTIQTVSQRQSLVVNTQLQQAIYMLQMSNQELHSYLDDQATENPFLEVAPAQTEAQVAPPRSEPGLPQSRAGGGSEDDFDYVQVRAEARPKSLYGHLREQFELIFDDPGDRAAAEVFLEALEPSGWLGEDLDQLAARAGVPGNGAEGFLARLQQVEPAGLFARNLAECLRLQAEDRRFLSEPFERLLENLPLVAKADIAGLCRVCGCDEPEVRRQLALLRCLDPKPGAHFNAEDHSERPPDLIARQDGDGWAVELNRATVPAVHVNAELGARVARCEETRAYVGGRLSHARWMRRAVEHRNRTTLAVGAEIVRRQTAFLEDGPARIRPMTLRDVAEAVGVHESTVSRVTTGMMIDTPQGALPLKAFFSTGLSGAGAGGEDQSAAAIRHQIQKLVREEDPRKPLSDDAIAQLVNSGGVTLARRTVAKYREALGIPSSFQRRRAARLTGA
ncbi:RNA polymerase factor sigma-54 [Rhodosalinus sp.]|uniref:RNA polymerase factor sigma-54 n=1 Tax=Rhodosalinus sp. TaxID=2047741 RepID=UPI00397A8667